MINNSILISVVVCSYNRAELVEGCLVSLAKQTSDFSMFEVIVVDNNSSDSSVSVVQNFRGLPNLRLVIERNQGLSHSRNRGLCEAQGIYIAYLDDDAIADSNYVDNAISIIVSSAFILDCLGGPILPFYTTEKPYWFKDKYEVRRNWDSNCYLKSNQSFSGSNMIWKKETLLRMGGFDPEYGMTGTVLNVGEESALFSKIWLLFSKPKLYYSRDLIVYHWVPNYKMKLSYRLKRSYIIGQFFGDTYQGKGIKRGIYFCQRSLLFYVRLFKAIIKVQQYRYWQNWIVEECTPLIILLGELLRLLGIRKIMKRDA